MFGGSKKNIILRAIICILASDLERHPPAWGQKNTAILSDCGIVKPIEKY